MASSQQNVVDLTPQETEQNSTEELERILRLVQFARVSALDIGEHNVCAQLLEVERELAASLARRDAMNSDGPEPFEAV